MDPIPTPHQTPIPDPKRPPKLRHRRSPRWPAIRQAWLRLHPECAACGQRDRVEVHHVDPVHVRPDRELDPTNLITLCEDGPGHTDCHLILGHCGHWSAWNPTVRADADRFRLMLRSRRTNP